jgi:tetratricopeptide (TPR) repeat protein
MYRRWVLASTVALAALAAALSFEARAQPLGMPVQRCGTAMNPRTADINVDELAAAAERAIDTQPRNVWPALGRLSMGACAIGSRDAVDRVFARCFTACVDETDRYVAEIEYATTLERFGDALGAELHFRRAIALKGEPEDALTAYTNYAAFLDRSGRARDALELLNRFALDSRAAVSVYPLKVQLMYKLGMGDSPEMKALMRAFIGPDGAGGPMRFGRPAIDVPLSAMPVEDNPLAQRPFAKRISVAADVTLEPRGRVTGVEPAHLYYGRVMMPDLSKREAKILIPRGETFDDVADLGATGCRILWHDARYDVEDCPWRAGSARASEARTIYAIVDDKVRTQSPLATIVPRPPLPLGDTPAFEPEPEWGVWKALYENLGAQGVRLALATSVLGHAGLDAGDTAALRGTGENYLRELARVDVDLRREIADRYSRPVEVRDPVTGVVLPPSGQIILGGTSTLPHVQIDPRALGGKTLQEALEADGVIARVDAQKDALLQAHFGTLEHLIGAAKLAALQRVVRSELAPGMFRSTRGVQLPRPAAQ